MNWQAVHVGLEGDDLAIGGLQIWREAWRITGDDALDLLHPDYRGQRHRYTIYEIGPRENPIRFAASELSNGVWGFYVPA